MREKKHSTEENAKAPTPVPKGIGLGEYIADGDGARLVNQSVRGATPVPAAKDAKPKKKTHKSSKRSFGNSRDDAKAGCSKKQKQEVQKNALDDDTSPRQKKLPGRRIQNHRPLLENQSQRECANQGRKKEKMRV